MFVLGLIRGAIAVLGFGVFNWRMRTALRVRPVRPVSGLPVLDVSIVIPARNEAQSLPKLLASIAALDPAPREVIVVDDFSSDDTAAIALAGGARVVSPGPLPAGWVGKPWACAAGAAVASCPVLLFTDADTVHGKHLLGYAHAALDAEQADLVSVLPAHLAVATWERFQAVFQLLLLVATRAGAEPTGSERCFCIGQYLLIRRTAYDRIGGHTALRERVAEDLAMARLIDQHGLRFSLVNAPGALSVRMYPEGLGSFVRGWRRNFREGLRAAGLSGVFETALVLAWLLDVPRWLIEQISHGDYGLIALGVGAAAISVGSIAYWQRRVGAFRARDAWAYPFFALLFVWISCLAVGDRVLRRPVQWKGRSVRVDA